jgi:hypothetical protein
MNILGIDGDASYSIANILKRCLFYTFLFMIQSMKLFQSLNICPPTPKREGRVMSPCV